MNDVTSTELTQVSGGRGDALTTRPMMPPPEPPKDLVSPSTPPSEPIIILVPILI